MNVLIISPLLVLLLLRSSLVIRRRRGNGNGKPWPNCNYFTITQGLRVITLTEELSKVTFVGITTHETIATWETDSWSFKSIGWREWKRLSIYFILSVSRSFVTDYFRQEVGLFLWHNQSVLYVRNASVIAASVLAVNRFGCSELYDCPWNMKSLLLDGSARDNRMRTMNDISLTPSDGYERFVIKRGIWGVTFCGSIKIALGQFAGLLV